MRSGQLVHAKGPKAQLIILGNVSSGAEVCEYLALKKEFKIMIIQKKIGCI